MSERIPNLRERDITLFDVLNILDKRNVIDAFLPYLMNSCVAYSKEREENQGKLAINAAVLGGYNNGKVNVDFNFLIEVVAKFVAFYCTKENKSVMYKKIVEDVEDLFALRYWNLKDFNMISNRTFLVSYLLEKKLQIVALSTPKTLYSNPPYMVPIVYERNGKIVQYNAVSISISSARKYFKEIEKYIKDNIKWFDNKEIKQIAFGREAISYWKNEDKSPTFYFLFKEKKKEMPRGDNL